jgi:hypothetical protein
MHSPRPFLRWTTGSFAIVWFVGMSTALAWVMADHLRPLKFASAAPDARLSQPSSKWTVKHVLVEGCTCSEAIAHYLCHRGPLPEAYEVVYVAQGNRQVPWTDQLSQAGFVVERRPGEQLSAQLGVEGGPSLLVVNPTGTVRYRGGYQNSRPREITDWAQIDPQNQPQDLLILSKLMKGQNVAPLPAFGCAVGLFVVTQ